MLDVAALFVDKNGCYSNLPNVHAWDRTRNAKLYSGPFPVVAHPPCSSWCQLAFLNKRRYGHEIGADDGCFEAALHFVRTYGGVLEHPAHSLAWPRFNLPKPYGRCWSRSLDGSWVAEVHQSAYGHPAKKRTWLYAFGVHPHELRWDSPPPTAKISFLTNRDYAYLPGLSKLQASKTPQAFRDALLAIARTAYSVQAHSLNTT